MFYSSLSGCCYIVCVYIHVRKADIVYTDTVIYHTYILYVHCSILSCTLYYSVHTVYIYTTQNICSIFTVYLYFYIFIPYVFIYLSQL